MAEPRKKKGRRGPYRERVRLSNDENIELMTNVTIDTLNETVNAKSSISEESPSTSRLGEMEEEENEFGMVDDAVDHVDRIGTRRGVSQSCHAEAATVFQFDRDEAVKTDFQCSDPALDRILEEMQAENEHLLIEDDDVLDIGSDVELDSADGFDTSATKKDSDSEPLYPGAKVTVGAFMLLLALFTTKYNLIGDATQQLLNIIAFALPSEHTLCTTLHEFKRFFRNLRNPLVRHYYCDVCLGYIEDPFAQECPHDFCKAKFERKNGSYFLEIPLEAQIQNLFAQDGFFESLQSRFKRSTEHNRYEDIYDGKLYKEHFQNNGLLSRPENISFTLNTDGAPVFKSSKVSIWPLFLIINELPYKQRMKKENMILASLWFGSKKPSMGTFLKPFQASMNKLRAGVECTVPQIGKCVTKGILLCGTADLPARSLLCNHIQYNGAFACWKCEQEGASASIGKGQCRAFPFNSEMPKGPERTDKNVLENARLAVNKQSEGRRDAIVKGIKGPSWLFFFPGFSMVSGIAIDYMHGVLLGVQKLLIELWFDNKHKGKPYSVHDKLCEVDQRLLSVRPTLDVTRLPRSIEKDLKYWKASEFRSFLLYYGAPVMHGILDKIRFDHYLLLVDALHILLKCGSLETDIDRAETMLVEFCKSFERMYALCFLRLNVHQLLHLPDCVRNLGPLYTHSCFSFENKNGVILKMIRGTQNIDTQIVTGVSFVQKLPELREKYIRKDSDMEKLYQAIEEPSILKRGSKLEDHVYVLGAMKSRTLSDEEKISLYSFLQYDPASDNFRSFSRLELRGDLIYGSDYSRMIKRDNSTVSYRGLNGTCFGQVRFFMQLEHDDNQRERIDTLAFLKKMQCINYVEGKAITAVLQTNELEVVPLSRLIGGCMLVSCSGDTRSFVCQFPNRLESD